jgi:2-oxoglutarate ferredoxin oxidoreductase subunit gamma
MGRTRIVFSGSGGQGVITAAIILAETAVLCEGLTAVQTQSYGAAARGGATRSDVIISNYPINFPKVIQPNILVTLTQEAYNQFSSIIRPGGLLITDTRFVKTHRKVDAVQSELPIYQTIMDGIGKPIVFNICTLGVVVGITELVKPASVRKILEDRIPPDFLAMNQKAFDLGVGLGQEAAKPRFRNNDAKSF